MEESFECDGMLGIYLYESFQLLEQMETIVLSEQNSVYFNRESIGELFRIMHTVKGSSGIMMYDNIALAAHKLEDIFYYLRETFAENIPAKVLTEYILKTSDFIMGELNKIKEGGSPDGNPDSLLNEIDRFLENWKAQMASRGVELPPENTYIAPNQYYIAPAPDGQDMTPIVIDLGKEPGMGDYVIGGKEENIVGVSEEKLSRLSNLVDKLKKAEKRQDDRSEWQTAKKKIMALTDEIEEAVRNMRQDSLAATFRRMKRIIFDVSRKLNKEIEFRTMGENLEVDRDIIAHITDPLMHIIRNAADHGIESGSERIQAGKEKKGRIVLEASINSDILYISVKDDGKGIDKEEIFRQAKKKGMLEPEEDIKKYTDKEIYTFITYPGFTTRKYVTEYSGRGVGMDAAVSKLKEIGGRLDIMSNPGKGTEMKIEVPLP